MSRFKLVVLSAVPLLWASVALAQTPPPAEPGAGPGWHHGPMMDRPAMHKAMCGDHYAHQVGRLAYLEAKLELTDQQRPLFAKWRQALLDGAAKHKAACLESGPKGDAKPTALDREAHLEKMLSAALQTLQASRPALQALYDSLTPAQRAVMDHHGHFGHRGHPGGEMHGPHEMPGGPGGRD
jgi:Spy/CpxP family protein refolding chaperone